MKNTKKAFISMIVLSFLVLSVTSLRAEEKQAGTPAQPTAAEQPAATKKARQEARKECQKEGKQGKELKKCIEEKLKK